MATFVAPSPGVFGRGYRHSAGRRVSRRPRVPEPGGRAFRNDDGNSFPAHHRDLTEFTSTYRTSVGSTPSHPLRPFSPTPAAHPRTTTVTKRRLVPRIPTPSSSPSLSPSSSPPQTQTPTTAAPGRAAATTTTALLEGAHTLPELVQQVLLSCSVGFAGLVGAKATETARALADGDRRAALLDAVSADVDSERRRAELADAPGDREWTDVKIDRLANRVVVPQRIPALPQSDELTRFDSLLRDVLPAAAGDGNGGEGAGGSRAAAAAADGYAMSEAAGRAGSSDGLAGAAGPASGTGTEKAREEGDGSVPPARPTPPPPADFGLFEDF